MGSSKSETHGLRPTNKMTYEILDTLTCKHPDPDADPNDVITAKLWNDGEIEISDLENSGIFIPMDFLDEIYTIFGRKFAAHKENIKFKRRIDG